MASCAVQVNLLVVRFLVHHVNNSCLGDRLFKYHYWSFPFSVSATALCRGHRGELL